MTAAAASVLDQALLLSEVERSMIAERLSASILQEDVLSDAQKATLDRRWEEITSGKVKCIPHEEGMSRMRAKYGI